MRHVTIIFFIFLSVIGTPSVFAQEKNSDLTHGNVQLHLKVDETTQLEVLEAFGAPNITTLDAEGKEVWVYRRHARITSSKSSSGGFTIGLLAGGSNVGGAAGFGKSKSKTSAEQSYRSMTLIIKFGPSNVVRDFRSRSSSF